jgi:hypothetical protein
MVPGSNPAILTEAFRDLPHFLRDNSGHRHYYDANVSVHNLKKPSITNILPYKHYIVWATGSVITKKINTAFKLPVDANDANLFQENIQYEEGHRDCISR